MNGNTYGKLLLSGVSFTSIFAMSCLTYEDIKRQNVEDYIQHQETSDIILQKSIEGSTYVSPYLRSYGSTYVKPSKVNEKVMPAINGNYEDNCRVDSCLILENLEDNVYRDGKCDLVSFTKITNNNQDKYDKYLNYFE